MVRRDAAMHQELNTSADSSTIVAGQYFSKVAVSAAWSDSRDQMNP